MMNITKFKFDYMNTKLIDACRNAIGSIDTIMQPGPIRVTQRKCMNGIINNRGRTYNWSIGKETNLMVYIIGVRCTFYEANTGPDIIPGNNTDSKFEKSDTYWWTDWNSNKWNKMTLFFSCNMDFSLIKILYPYNIDSDQLTESDVRIMNSENDLYIYNPKLSNITHKITCGLSSDRPYGMITLSDPIRNDQIGNNYGMIKIGTDNYLYLDWIYENGIKYKKYDRKTKSTIEKVLPYSDLQYILDGNGSYDGEENNSIIQNSVNYGIMPLFSFGTPHIIYPHSKNTYIGIGHIKIYTDADVYPYKENSSIQIFRNNLYTDMKKMYGAKYIRHDAYNSNSRTQKGYNYLMYFYYIIVDDDDIITEMKISASFLPLCFPDTADYIFSLIFPMGITIHENDLLVSCGYGDYYSVLLTFNIEEVFELCTYDITNLDLRMYKYKILTTDNKSNIHIVDRLNDTSEQFGGHNMYYKKYLKYKNKYIQLKYNNNIK